MFARAVPYSWRVGYAVKEIVYTLQGEGARAGRPAVFLRFAGCNLWSGREADRDLGPGSCSAWCDTDFVGTDGPGGGTFATAAELADAVAAAWGIRGQAPSFPEAGDRRNPSPRKEVPVPSLRPGW